MKDKVGNDGSDEAAGKGVQQHGNDLLEMSNYFAQAHAEYGKFVAHVHDFILKLMIEIDKIRNPHSKGKKQSIFNKVVLGQNSNPFEPASKMTYVDTNEAFNIDLGKLPSRHLVTKRIDK